MLMFLQTTIKTLLRRRRVDEILYAYVRRVYGGLQLHLRIIELKQVLVDLTL